MSHSPRTPLLFVGHGNPMNAIEDNRFSAAWDRIGRELPKPKTIVCMSAHWMTEGSCILSAAKPETIYDFYGFPPELYRIRYPVSGNPVLADEIHRLQPDITATPGWGIDHGAWSVIRRMFPDAGIPVIQLSTDMSSPPRKQYELIRTIRELRERGVMFIGSGNIVHNLGLAGPRPPYDWAIEFEHTARDLIAGNGTEKLLDYRSLGDAAALSIPTDDHYRPLLNTMALLYDDEIPEFFNEGIDLASVSMLSVRWG
jgi:4,5-DOPA dioxygenase extradiol